MPKLIDLSGQRFGRWSVIKRGPDHTPGAATWRCKCDCGTRKNVRTSMLKSGKSKSCGCLAKEVWAKQMGALRRSHGMSKTPEYRSWLAMRSRCYKKASLQFEWYGGRGIKVCERWKNSFENFMADMGERPSPKHTIDRIDNDGDYSPDNCKWSTPVEQCNNRRSSRFLTVNGKTLPLVKWARLAGVHPSTILERMKAGWPMEKALTATKTDPRDTPAIQASIRKRRA